MTVSGVDSVECAFTYMNAVFRQNLTVVFTVDGDHSGIAATPAAHSATLRTSEVPPDDCDTHPGVSDPPNRARDRDRGVAEGVAHAPDDSLTAADSRADCDTGGTERRPLTPHQTRRLQRTSPNPSRPALAWTSPCTR